MTTSPGTDRETLTQHAYATDDKLRVRQQTHEQYTVPRVDFMAWVLDRIAWRGDEWVLDVGAGQGGYFAATAARIPQGRLVAGDLSFGMVRQQADCAVPGWHANLDAQALPFPADTFDVVLANHMLYHVPDLDRALADIRRVLKPEGVLVAATNSIHNMPELATLRRRALLVLTNFANRGVLDVPDISERFSLENALPALGRHFYAVARYDLPSRLEFARPEPLLDYLDSLRDLREADLPAGITWERFMEVVRQQVLRLMGYAGRMTVKKLAGVLVATDSGDFASDYVAMLRSDQLAE